MRHRVSSCLACPISGGRLVKPLEEIRISRTPCHVSPEVTGLEDPRSRPFPPPPRFKGTSQEPTHFHQGGANGYAILHEALQENTIMNSSRKSNKVALF